MGHEVLEVSGDVGIRAWGRSPQEAFAEAGVGTYGLITGLGAVKAREEREMRVEADSLDSLLVRFLNELIFAFDAYGFIGRNIVVREFDGTALAVCVEGEEFDPSRHERRLLVKAATYHKLKISEAEGQWHVEVIFDI